MNAKKKVIVVGNGMVGYKFCEKLLDKDDMGQIELTVFGSEPRPAYDRVHLSAYFAAQDEHALQMQPLSWYATHGVELITGDAIVDIDVVKKEVLSHHGVRRSYDSLVLATGSNCFMPPINGSEKEGVFLYRTIEDLDKIIAYAKNCTSAAVLGGGLLGLEAAKAMLDLNLTAHVVEFAPRLMARQLDDVGAALLKRKIESVGVGVHLSKSTKEIVGEGKVEGLLFADEQVLPVDMLVVSAGIVPNDALGRLIDLKVGNRGGIVVNEFMQTSEPDIYAIGEVALFKGMVYGLVAPGYDMAEVVAHNLLNPDMISPKSFSGADMSTKLKLIGVEVGSFGDAFAGAEQEALTIVYEDELKGYYKRINVSKDKKKLLGGVLVGDTSEYGILQQMTLNAMKLPEHPESLIIKIAGGESAGISVADLPDSALICSCEGVSKGVICDAVKNGCEELGALKGCTKAGTNCGGCLPLVKDLMEVTFKSMGKVVKKSICEHFSHTRQELFHIIKVKGYKKYNEVLDAQGHGDGCEICKPAVASLLASIWNDPILNNKNEVAQDTNDRFLANIQKGGTYSVVPRIPGGEITPEKLIVIGQVAEKFKLYTKITGGQRIDLFGAQLNDLPAIWSELIAAGMESGHAYGKSLRTVKSCVGETWCRYGVQDSVGFAIDVENRYKGLRSPHKLKSAVSGCTRECAEAQSKDFGIIATDKGWNLYVGGNGGTKPQHAALFASDIDSATCLKYIDRFLMFYIQTADLLQRTAPWLNKLEGGIEYLKEVVINDSLGICAELDALMQHHADTYVCEWKDAVEDESKRKRFTHFVNSDARDPKLQFIEVRGQLVPAHWH